MGMVWAANLDEQVNGTSQWLQPREDQRLEPGYFCEIDIVFAADGGAGGKRAREFLSGRLFPRGEPPILSRQWV